MSGLCAGFNDRLETLAKLILLHMGPVQWVPLPSSRVLCTTRQLPWGILWLSITLSGIYRVRDSQWVGAGSASSPTNSDHCSHFQQLFLNCFCEKWKSKKILEEVGLFCEDGNKCSVHIRQSRSFWGKWPNKHVAWLALATDVFQLKAVDFITLFCHCGGAWGSWSVDPGPCFRPWRLFTLVHECHFAVNAMYRLKVWKSFQFPVQTPQLSARNDCEGAVRSKFNSYILGNALTDWARSAINVKSNRSPQVWRTVENH